MLARTLKLRHPSGVTLETPLLVPSFSSKGFRLNRKGVSEITEALRITAEVLTDSMLISAYDIFHKFIPRKIQPIPEIIFVDSGGYETADDHDLSSVFRHSCPVKKWNERFLRQVFDSWPDHIAAVFVNFDHGKHRRPLLDQIEAAQELFAHYPKQLHALIIKPERTHDLTLDRILPKVFSNIDKLATFHMVGVTEKEIGDSLLLRMQNISKIRVELDNANINVPLQIFGSLDPLSSCLYFLAGADIFDGLTWLRYSYLDGVAIYNFNYGALKVGVHERDDLVQARALVDNIYYLRRLQYQMKEFLLESDFGKFGHHAQLIQTAYDMLRTKQGGKL